ncbi:MAG: hypothetical protein V4735_01050 [Pseudomonadota bacterium]
MTQNMVTIHIKLLDEGFETAKRAQALVLGNDAYKILLPADYDPEDEKWEFAPGDIVRCELQHEGWPIPMLIAVEKLS